MIGVFFGGNDPGFGPRALLPPFRMVPSSSKQYQPDITYEIGNRARARVSRWRI